jgi:hypothetical protein
MAEGSSLVLSYVVISSADFYGSILSLGYDPMPLRPARNGDKLGVGVGHA